MSEKFILNFLMKNYPILTAIFIILIPVINELFFNRFSVVQRQMRIVRIFVETMINRMQLSYASHLIDYTNKEKKFTSSEIATAIKFHEILLKGVELYAKTKLREIVELNHIPNPKTKDFDRYCDKQFELVYEGMEVLYGNDYCPKVHIIPYTSREKKWSSHKEVYKKLSKELLRDIQDVKKQSGGFDVFKRFFTHS